MCDHNHTEIYLAWTLTNEIHHSKIWLQSWILNLMVNKARGIIFIGKGCAYISLSCSLSIWILASNHSLYLYLMHLYIINILATSYVHSLHVYDNYIIENGL